MQTHQLLAAALTLSVLIYMGPMRGLEMTNGSFAACLLLLLLALALISRNLPHLPHLLHLPEAFTEAEAIYQRVLQPRLDRLVDTVGGQSGTQEYTQAPHKSAVTVDGSRIPEDLPKETRPLQVATEFQRISFLLCKCMQAFPAQSLAMYRTLGVPPPEFEDLSKEPTD